MSPGLASVIYCLFILWLLWLDRRRRPAISPALWLVVVWVALLCTQRVSAWLAIGSDVDSSQDQTDGNTIDRNVIAILGLFALIVLIKRRVNWGKIIRDNPWLACFYLFFGISAIWSDYPFVSFKRWVTDLENLMMVLVVLTDSYPIDAARAVFARCAYLLIPLSVLFIKYYPLLGRGYSAWTGQAYYRGASMGKNQLGGALLVVMLFLIWEAIHMVRNRSRRPTRMELLSFLVLLAMGMWLLAISNCVTSLTCTVVGGFGLVVLNFDFVRKRLQHLVAYGVGAAAVIIVLSTVVDLKSDLTEMLGRDPTLHGRDEIWKAVLEEQTNPLIGTGFSSFWLGKRPERIQEKTQQFYLLNQAHNGYLEVYLNGGIIGVCALLAMLGIAGKQINKQLLYDPDWGGLRLIFWFVVLIHNWSEATFCRDGPLWFVLLLVVLEYPVADGCAADYELSEQGHILPQSDAETAQSLGTSVAN